MFPVFSTCVPKTKAVSEKSELKHPISYIICQFYYGTVCSVQERRSEKLPRKQKYHNCIYCPIKGKAV